MALFECALRDPTLDGTAGCMADFLADPANQLLALAVVIVLWLLYRRRKG